MAGLLSQERDRGVIQTDDLVLPKLKGLGPDDDPMAELARLETTIKDRVRYLATTTLREREQDRKMKALEDRIATLELWRGEVEQELSRI